MSHRADHTATHASALWRDRAVAALAIVTSVPLAVVLLPNRLGLLLPAMQRELQASSGSLVQAMGAALPVAAATVPLAALVAQRLRAWTVLLLGLVVAAIALGLGGQQIGSVGLLALVRGLQGLGAGTILAAAAALVFDAAPAARPLLSGLWAGALVASLVAVAPVPFDAGDPGDLPGAYVWLLVVALVAAVLLAVMSTVMSTRNGAVTVRGDTTAGMRNPLVLWAAVAMAAAAVVVTGTGSGPGITVVAVIWLTGAAVVATTAREAGETRTAAALPLVALVVGATAFPVASSSLARWMTVQVLAGTSPLEAVATARSHAWLPLAAAGAVAVIAALVAAARGGRSLVVAGLAIAAVGALGTLPFNLAIALVTPGLVLLGLGTGLALGAAAADAAGPALRLGVGLFASGLAAGTLLADVIATWSTQALMNAAAPTSDGALQLSSPLPPVISGLRMWFGNALAAGLLGSAAAVVAISRRRDRRVRSTTR